MSVENFKRNVWMLGIAILWIAFALAPGLFTSIVLDLSSRQAAAVITAAPLEHDICKYQFSVDNREVIGTGYKCGNAPLGSSLTISYWPANPSVSSNIIPGSDYASIRTDVLIVLAVFIGSLLGAYFIPSRD